MGPQVIWSAYAASFQSLVNIPTARQGHHFPSWKKTRRTLRRWPDWQNETNLSTSDHLSCSRGRPQRPVSAPMHFMLQSSTLLETDNADWTATDSRLFGPFHASFMLGPPCYD
jgi:hypothetical protein